MSQIRRLRRSRRPGCQLSFVGFDARRSEASRASCVARSGPGPGLGPGPGPGPAAGTPSARAGARSRPRANHSAGLRESVLSPTEQMETLLRHPHLMRSQDREWVTKIGETVSARGPGAGLSDRQQAVICDIFDRLRERIGR